MRIRLSALLTIFVLTTLSFAAADGRLLLNERFERLGTWDSFTGTSVAGGRLVMTLDNAAAEESNDSLYNGATFKDCDVSATVHVTLKPPLRPDDASGGLLFWGAKDPRRFYFLSISPGGSYCVMRYDGTKFTMPAPWTRSDVVKPDRNVLRVSMRGTTATAYINGQDVVRIKGEPPTGGGKIGLKGSTLAAGAATWSFSDVRVTAP